MLNEEERDVLTSPRDSASIRRVIFSSRAARRSLDDDLLLFLELCEDLLILVMLKLSNLEKINGNNCGMTVGNSNRKNIDGRRQRVRGRQRRAATSLS